MSSSSSETPAPSTPAAEAPASPTDLPLDAQQQQQQGALGGYKQPCALGALLSGIPSGVIGWTFGFLPSVFTKRGIQNWRAWLDDGGKSGRSLFTFSASYSLVHCIMTRVRQVDDAFNRGVAGCATGLAIGWSGGPVSAAQSCVAIGLISYLVDFGGGEEAPAQASTSASGMAAAGGRGQRGRHARGCCSVELGQRPMAHATAAGPRRGRGASATPAEKHGRALALQHTRARGPVLSLPPVMWLGAMCGGGRGYLESPFSG